MGSQKLQLKEIWLSGVPLSEAWLAFASPDERRGFLALDGAELEIPEDLVAEGGHTMQAVAQAAAGLKKWGDVCTARGDLKDSLRHRLEKGDPVAIGYDLSAPGISRPTLIDPDIFVVGEIHWGDGKVEFNELEFVKVVLVSLSAFSEARKAKSPKGRKRKAHCIDQAIENAEKLIPRLLSMRNDELIPIIQKECECVDKAGFELGKGYSDSNILARLAHARKRKQDLA